FPARHTPIHVAAVASTPNTMVQIVAGENQELPGLISATVTMTVLLLRSLFGFLPEDELAYLHRPPVELRETLRAETIARGAVSECGTRRKERIKLRILCLHHVVKPVVVVTELGTGLFLPLRRCQPVNPPTHAHCLPPYVGSVH